MEMNISKMINKLYICGFNGVDISKLLNIKYYQVRCIIEKRKIDNLFSYRNIESLNNIEVKEILELIKLGFSIYDISLIYKINMKKFIMLYKTIILEELSEIKF